MSDALKETMAVGLSFALLIGVACTGVLVSEKIQADYKIEALVQAKDCEPCQIIILTKER